MKLYEIINEIERVAPLQYQENYDNSGLICGNAGQEVKGVLICLDSVEAVIDEAIELNCNVVIAHHPIIFSGLKKINGNTYIERVIIKAIKHDIAIYACHTNLDNVYNGVNAVIADKLGLINTHILSIQKNSLKKLVTFVPENKLDDVRDALFLAGAGHIGNYSKCSFNTTGIGTFKADDQANPYVGTKGKMHEEQEVRIESVYAPHIEKKLIQSLIQSHPYEEVAYDIIPLGNSNKHIGSGMIGELHTEMDELPFLEFLKSVMQAGCIRYTQSTGKKIKKVAVCGGSGSFLLQDAVKAGADVFISADFKYHQFFDADKQILIADIGHYETEQFTMQLFYDILTKKFSTFAIHLTKINTNPIKYL